MAAKNPQTVTAFYVSPNTVTQGSSAVVVWACQCATAVYLNGVSVNKNHGSKVVNPGTTTIYQLDVDGSDPRITLQTTLTVVPPVLVPPPPPPPILPDTIPPTASIILPTGGTVGGLVTFVANASDNVGVTRVDLLINNVVVASASTAPYRFSWNSNAITSGTVTAKVIAYDAAGNAGTSAVVTLTVSNIPQGDITPPVVSITSPTSGSVSGIVPVVVNATDNVGVTQVNLIVNSVSIATLSLPPWTFQWDSTRVANGSTTLNAKAFDGAGNTATSGTVTVTVANPVVPPPDVTPPTVMITSPATGATVTGMLTIVTNAQDNVAVLRVDFLANGLLIGSANSFPWQFAWNSVSVADGLVQLKAVAYDSAGNSGTSATVAVTVANVVPIPPNPPPPPFVAAFAILRTGVQYADFASAHNAAIDGDTILVAPTNYDINGFGAWWTVTKQLTVKSAVPGQRYTRRNTTPVCNAGFFHSSTYLRIEDCYLIGVRVEYDNTSSVHDDHYYGDPFATGQNPYTLYFKNCKIEEWPNGMLTSTYANCALTFDSCDFLNNGTNDGFTHDIYQAGYGTGSTLVMGCRFMQDFVGPGPDENNKAARGHKIKSNAKKTEVYGNLIDQGVARNTDIVNNETGGEVIVKGNMMRKSANSDNPFRVNRYGGTGFDNLNGAVTAVSGNTITAPFPNGGFTSAYLNQTMTFTDGIPPSPLVLNTTYYLRDIASSSFSLSASHGGPAITLTSTTIGASVRIARPIPAGYVWAYTFEQNTVVQNCVGFGTVLIQTDSVSAALATFTVKDNLLAGEFGDASLYPTNSYVALTALVGQATYDQWRVAPPVNGSGSYATLAYSPVVGTTPRTDTYRGGLVVSSQPAWAAALAASSITTVSLNTTASIAPAGLTAEFNAMSQSFSGTTFSPWWGTAGGIIANGGGGYLADKFVAAVWDVSTRLWSALWTYNSPLTAADFSEIGLAAIDMSGYVTAFDNTGHGVRYYKPLGSSAWSDPLLWGFVATRPFNLGEASLNVPMSAHEYDSCVAIPPGKLGTGAFGGLMLTMRTFATENQGLCSLYPHVLDLAKASVSSTDKSAWQVLPEIPVPSGGNTNANKLFGNTIANATTDYSPLHGGMVLWSIGGSGRATLGMTLSAPAGSVAYAVLGDDNLADTIPNNAVGRMMGGTDTRIFVSPNGASALVQGIDMNPATASSGRRVVTITNLSGIGPVCGASIGFLGLSCTWVAGYASGGRTGAFALFTADSSGTWPKAVFWLVPPTDRTTWASGQWLWDREDLTGDTPIQVASETWGRFQWADTAKVGLWCGDDRTGVQAIKSSRVI